MTVHAHLRIPVLDEDYFEALRSSIAEDGPESGLVFVADRTVGSEWNDVSAELLSAFELSRVAVMAAAPIVYVVWHADLLGAGGDAGAAMVAAGLLSGSRSAAVEMQKAGVPVNVLAIEDDTPAATTAAWVARLLALEPGGPAGEVVRLGSRHLGKTLP